MSGTGISLVGKHFDEFKVITVLDISGNKLTDRDGVVVAEIIQVIDVVDFRKHFLFVNLHCNFIISCFSCDIDGLYSI